MPAIRNLLIASLVVGAPLIGKADGIDPAAQDILRQNAQLSALPGWPAKFDRNLTIQNCVHQLKGRADVQVTSKHRCIDAWATVPTKPHETKLPEKRFMLVLHLNTPRVWKVYDSSDRLKLVAEFDSSGGKKATSPDDTLPQGGQAAPASGPDIPQKGLTDLFKKLTN